ncbi:hypothetical protein SLA2020_321070 [Shorea laevis]
MLTEKENIWAKAFRDKFNITSPNSSLDKSSPVIRNIKKGKHIIDRGIKWIPRTGDKVSFWNDKWAGNVSINSMIYGPHKPDSSHITVKDALLPSGEWNWDLIAYSLPIDIVNNLKAIPLQYSNLGVDTFTWGFSSNGLFKSKSAYYLAKNLPLHSDCSWSWVCRVDTIPRIQFFLWLLKHNRLLTYETLFNWGIIDSNICPRCHQAPETINHIFRECFFAKLLWSLVTPHPINTLYQNLDFDGWLYAHSTHAGLSDGRKWSTSFSYIIWSLWYCRNQLVHERKRISIVMARDFILNKINEYNQLHPTPSNTKSFSTSFVGWNSPPPGFIKLNTDGSANLKLGDAGAGGVFQDELGNWLLGFYRNVGCTSSLSAELWALRDGLKLAIDRGFSHLLVETDSKVAKTLLEYADSVHHSLGVLIDDCRAMMTQIPDLQLNHIFREANAVADGLAKKGAKSDSRFAVLEQCPSDLCNILYSDIIGNKIPRTTVVL